MNNTIIKKPGNQPLTQDQVDDIFRQLEPLLKGGYSVRKACDMAELPKSTVYDLINRDQEFADRIDTSRQFLAELTSSIVATELMTIKARQASGDMLTKGDRSFVQWFATNHFSTRETFGQKTQQLFDPQAEIMKLNAMIDEIADDDYDS